MRLLPEGVKTRDLFHSFLQRACNDKIDFADGQREVMQLLLIRPTRYDDEGYPIQWKKSFVPSNSLACLYGIALDAAKREILGPEIEIRVTTIDEANEIIDYPRLIRSIKNSNHRFLICLAGVQTNQFPRAIDIGSRFTAAGIPVCLGGFHVSGCISMLDELPPELRDAQAQDISLFAGEAEDQRFDRVVRDAWNGELAPLYDYHTELLALEGQPLPYVSEQTIENIMSKATSIDLGRGCPFHCAFCCIINVHGRKSRYRSPDDLEHLVRNYARQGFKDIFITDDDFARNKQWEAYFDRLIQLRREGIEMNLIIQVDSQCHKISGFIDKAVQAGVLHVFIGLENINPDNLALMNKRQNKITEYRKMLLAWKKHPVIIWGAYILGLPNDTRASILRDVEIIKKELPIDVFNPSIYTPLPGSELHRDMLANGEWMNSDLNKYDLTHPVIHHQSMTDAELNSIYDEVSDSYYTDEHMQTVIKRMFALGSNKKISTLHILFTLGYLTKIFKVRSYDIGMLRYKSRLERRPGYPVEPWLPFHFRRIVTTMRDLWRVSREYRRLHREVMRIFHDPHKEDYRDMAITPPSDADYLEMDMYNSTRGGKGEVEKVVLHRKRSSSPA